MWKISNLISTFFLLNLYIIKSETNNTNIVSLKFKTYYPYINSSHSVYEAEDYYFNVHLSKIYLEIGFIILMFIYQKFTLKLDWEMRIILQKKQINP